MTFPHVFVKCNTCITRVTHKYGNLYVLAFLKSQLVYTVHLRLRFA